VPLLWNLTLPVKVWDAFSIVDSRSTKRWRCRFAPTDELPVVESWLRAFKAGKLERIGSNQRPLSDVEMELARVKRELTVAWMERDILKKAAAYFAKESLHGTR
jgi:hypothetical protein